MRIPEKRAAGGLCQSGIVRKGTGVFFRSGVNPAAVQGLPSKRGPGRWDRAGCQSEETGVLFFQLLLGTVFLRPYVFLFFIVFFCPPGTPLGFFERSFSF